MREIELSAIRNTEFTICELAGARQNWKNGEKFSYLNPPRANNGFLLVLCKRAVFTFGDGEELTVEKNGIAYMPQDSRYLVRFEQENPLLFPASVVLHFTLLDDRGERLIFGEKPRLLTTDENGDFKKLFLRVVDGYLANDRLLLARDFLTLLHELLQAEQGKEEPLLAITEYISDALYELPSVQTLAKKFAMSESTLRRAFVKTLGCSPIRYIHGVKIEKAKRMLALPENTVEEIGAELGFFDAAHFNKVFRRYVGCSPKRYREGMRPQGE